MAAPTPFVLTSATRFQPAHLRRQSRSPSRSPLRKSQFAARELDPLLKNLSPESTLEALQTTATIKKEDNGQDALTRSIAEASPSEREIGIRAAVAAQKLKEWHQEVLKWSWPARRDRGWGAGFLPLPNPTSPTTPTESSEDVSYLGMLPTLRVTEYQDRIEDIRDGIEALDLEDVKDHVFSAHVPYRSFSAPHSLEQSAGTRNTGYGRMRDFTALITATVIQALPELANLNLLLDAWDIRLSVLRQIPDVSHSFRTTKAGLSTAFTVVRSHDAGPLVTMEEYKVTKDILGGKVASLGAKIDKLLDMLEGQEDSLPKIWIDTLETIENEYAAWVVEAEHIAIRNNLLSKTLPEHNGPRSNDNATLDMRTTEGSNDKVLGRTSPNRRSPRKVHSSDQPALPVFPTNSRHNRGISEVSIADSAYSAMSGISSAEIVDARSTQVLAGPEIHMVDNPFRASRDELSFLTVPNQTSNTGLRPPMLQRASTASIEVISRNSVKQVVLTRSRSLDMLGRTTPPSDRAGTPSQALESLSGAQSVYAAPDTHPREQNVDSHIKDLLMPPEVPSSTVSPSPSLRVQPLVIRAKSNEVEDSQMPAIPRRSSKRLSQSFPSDADLPVSPTIFESTNELPSTLHTTGPTALPQAVQSENLEARIKDILNTMPNKIRLGKESDSELPQTASNSTTRSTTPVPALTLSPVKGDKAGRHASSGDIRVFHLTKSGQSRDTPVKLHVRAVGENGERVMVRVGGGWADLAEYLREYSSHHGHRALNNGGLEVANFPNSHTLRKDQSSIPMLSENATPDQAVARPSILPGTTSGLTELTPLTVDKVRKHNRDQSSDTRTSTLGNNWVPPPVPPIPATYSVQMPTTVTTTADGVTRTRTINPINLGQNHTPRAVSNPITYSSSGDGKSHSTTVTTSSPSSGGTTYTPLGAAGPKSSGRRVVSHNVTSNVVRESWVEGMIDKARAVSGTTTVYQGPTTTTTTTLVSKPRPTSRRSSILPSFKSANNTSNEDPPTPDSKAAPAANRAKNRISLGDVNSIKRVFLRRKSDRSRGFAG